RARLRETLAPFDVEAERDPRLALLVAGQRLGVAGRQVLRDDRGCEEDERKERGLEAHAGRRASREPVGRTSRSRVYSEHARLTEGAGAAVPPGRCGGEEPLPLM